MDPKTSQKIAIIIRNEHILAQTAVT